MSPTRVESYFSPIKRWVNVSRINPGASITLPNFSLDGTRRDNYRFTCAAGDSHTNIEISKNAGVLGQEDAPFEVFKEIKDGESIELKLRTFAHTGPRRLRITHTKGK